MTSQTHPPSNQDLLTLFAQRLEAAGGSVAQATTQEDLASVIRQIAKNEGGDPGVTLWMSSGLHDAAPELVQTLARSGHHIAVPDDPGAVRDQPLGIAIASAAIAETGSVILVEPEVADRAVTLMTQALIVACPLAALLPSLDEAATVLREISGKGPSYVTFVTGPSRTADIERELTVGVQGPGKLYVVFVEDSIMQGALPSSAA